MAQSVPNLFITVPHEEDYTSVLRLLRCCTGSNSLFAKKPYLLHKSSYKDNQNAAPSFPSVLVIQSQFYEGRLSLTIQWLSAPNGCDNGVWVVVFPFCLQNLWIWVVKCLFKGGGKTGLRVYKSAYSVLSFGSSCTKRPEVQGFH